MNRIRYFVFLSVIMVQACSTSDEPAPVDNLMEFPILSDQLAVDKKGRILGMDILDETPSSTYFQNFTTAREAKIEFVHVHFPWTAFEPEPEQLIDPNDAMANFNAFVSSQEVLFNLTIRPIDLTGKTVPSDLENTRFSDPKMVARMKSLLDFILQIIPPERFTNIQIGNEIDGYDTTGEHPDFWSDYQQFLREINTHLDSNYPGLLMGFTGTFHGLTAGPLNDQGIFRDLAESVDIVGVTYYPQDQGFEVRSPDIVEQDLQHLTDKFPGETIYLQEVGYQTSDENSSSTTKQAQFIQEFFNAWDNHADQIPLANWVRLHDVSDQKASELAGPYGLSSTGFLEYLRTLGVITFQGERKHGFVQLVHEVEIRNW